MKLVVSGHLNADDDNYAPRDIEMALGHMKGSDMEHLNYFCLLYCPMTTIKEYFVNISAIS